MEHEDQVHVPDGQYEPRVAVQLLQYMAGSQGTTLEVVAHLQVQSFFPLVRMEQDVYVQLPPLRQPAPAYRSHVPYVAVQLSVEHADCRSCLPSTL